MGPIPEDLMRALCERLAARDHSVIRAPDEVGRVQVWSVRELRPGVLFGVHVGYLGPDLHVARSALFGRLFPLDAWRRPRSGLVLTGHAMVGRTEADLDVAERAIAATWDELVAPALDTLLGTITANDVSERELREASDQLERLRSGAETLHEPRPGLPLALARARLDYDTAVRLGFTDA